MNKTAVQKTLRGLAIPKKLHTNEDNRAKFTGNKTELNLVGICMIGKKTHINRQ